MGKWGIACEPVELTAQWRPSPFQSIIWNEIKGVLNSKRSVVPDPDSQPNQRKPNSSKPDSTPPQPPDICPPLSIINAAGTTTTGRTWTNETTATKPNPKTIVKVWSCMLTALPTRSESVTVMTIEVGKWMKYQKMDKASNFQGSRSEPGDHQIRRYNCCWMWKRKTRLRHHIVKRSRDVSDDMVLLLP